VLELEDEGRNVQLAADRCADAQEFFGKIAFDHAQKSAQALAFIAAGHVIG
jgi:hypothetical protein